MSELDLDYVIAMNNWEADQREKGENKMSDPNLPEGVTQKDIDRTVGETLDPNKPEDQVLILQKRLDNIKTLVGYFTNHHPPTCQGWDTHEHKIIFQSFNCDCIISDILHEISMAEDFL